MSEDELDKSLMIFGTDVTKIPCFRKSILTGVGSAVAGGLLGFLFTSKPRVGGHCAVGIFCSVTMGTFIHCRHNWAIQKFNSGQIRQALKDRMIDDPEEVERRAQRVEIVKV